MGSHFLTSNMIRLLLIIASCVALGSALSCNCGAAPCQTPVCCDSGFYTLDECGCCLTCAKAEDQECGGPFRIAGQCAAGLRCLRQCDCRTEQGSSCVFPFTYKGVTYKSCTTAESDNNKAWCATEVDSEGVVVNNKWQDCAEGCPGTPFVCNEGFLFNEMGRCVNGTQAPALLNQIQQARSLAASLDDIPSESSQKPAPVCEVGRTIPGEQVPDEIHCRCTREALVKGLDGNPKGGCVPPRDDVGISDLEQGYWFLENILDFTQPERNCYEDVAWSEVDGGFWSNIACVEEHRQPQPCLSTLNKPCIFPFTFQGETFTGCTHRGSENGAAWCATEVDGNGNVVTNAWEDCQASCPMDMN